MTKLSEQNFKLANYTNNRWSVVPGDGVPFDALLAPEYWAHVARKLQPGDTIEVHAVDGTYFAELYVRSASRLEARVAVLHKTVFDTQASEASSDDGLIVRFRNHVAKWAVIRTTDNEIMKSGFTTREVAEEWLRDRRKAA